MGPILDPAVAPHKVWSMATSGTTQRDGPAGPGDRTIVCHWIDGERYVESGGRTATGFDPASGEAAREVQLAALQTVDVAVASSRAAFDAWRALSLSRRMPIMHSLRAGLIARADDLVDVISAEH